MGTVECLKQQHHHHQVQQLHKYHQMNSSSFKIPMWLCMRPSITQEDHYNEAQDHHEKNKSKKNRRSNSIDEDQPGSPKVGCMGQVKHTHQQQLTFLSTNNHHHHQHTTNNNKKYFKLKKMFSSNSFHYNRTTSRKCITGPNNSSKLIHNHNTKDQQAQHASSSSESSSTSSFSLVSIGDLDPPLPVIKRSLTSTNVCSSDVSSIWKRRCGGEAALKGLQLSSSSATIQRPINSIVIIPQPLASL